MDLSGLESADPVDTKDVRQCRFRIVWDHLGWFPPQVVPVLWVKTLSDCAFLPPPHQTRFWEEFALKVSLVVGCT
jgi:hypothetical protein